MFNSNAIMASGREMKANFGKSTNGAINIHRHCPQLSVANTTRNPTVCCSRQPRLAVAQTGAYREGMP